MYVDLKALEQAGFQINLHEGRYLVVSSPVQPNGNELVRAIRQILDKHFGEAPNDGSTTDAMIRQFVEGYSDRMILDQFLGYLILGADHNVPS